MEHGSQIQKSCSLIRSGLKSTLTIISNRKLQFGGLSINNVATSQIQTVVSHNQFLAIRPVHYEFSADRSVYVLVNRFSMHLNEFCRIFQFQKVSAS